jgi:hypothetical protein
MQLYATVRAKAEARFFLTAYPLGFNLKACRASKHCLDLPPDSRFQYRNANQFPVCCGLALISENLVFRNPATSHSAHQQQRLQFADVDLLQVLPLENENGVFLIGPLDFERVGNLVSGADLGDGHTSRAVLLLHPSPCDCLPLARIMGFSQTFQY